MDVYHVQIGIGAAGAEVPIAEFEEGTVINGAGSTVVSGTTVRLPAVKIPAGARNAYRIYDENAGPGSGGAGMYLALLPYAGALTWDTWDDRYAQGDRALSSVRVPAVGAA